MFFVRKYRLIMLCIFFSAKLLCAEEANVENKKEITQYGITWIFQKPVECGRFITGDWWVIGPVTVERVLPAPGPAEEDNKEIFTSMYGVAGTIKSKEMRNGSMIVVKSEASQGYDSRIANYSSTLTVRYPITLKPGTSLVSTISNPDEMVNNLFHKHMWSSEKKSVFVLNTAAILTVLEKIPPADAFRPPYAGQEKPIYTYSQVATSKLLNLPPPASIPAWEEFERYLQRPWLDHMQGWLHQVLGPNENQVNYGREFSRITGIAGLMLNTKAPIEKKKKLLIGLLQLGIDITGVIDAGRQYCADGGHYSGRKFPVMFAGYMLNDDRMLHASRISNFAEDMQTYYGTGWAGQKTLFQIVTHTGIKPPYEHVAPENWGDNEILSERYRKVNGTAWPAPALAIRLMGLIKEWDHDAWFDINDRWMSSMDPYAEQRSKSTIKKYQTRDSLEGKTHDRFVNDMWKIYRLSTPEATWADNCRQWTTPDGWIANTKPSLPVEVYNIDQDGK